MHKSLPIVYHFNPTCEYAIANGTVSWQPNRILQKMEADLSSLPMFLAEQKDYILVDKKPGDEFLSEIEKLKPEIPNFYPVQLLKKDAFSAGIERLAPWGWSPAEHHKLRILKPQCEQTYKDSPVFNWNPEHKGLYSKLFASKLLQDILKSNVNPEYMPLELASEKCQAQNEIEKLIQAWGMIMVKSPWSSSGRGLQPVRHSPVHQKVWEKVLGIIRDQGYVMVEPYHNKILDLALQFKLMKGKVEYIGTSNFYTDYKGQYNGNHLNGLPEDMNRDVIEFTERIKPVLIHDLAKAIEASPLSDSFEGYFGVDCLIYENDKEQLRINPCMEINLRYNMGLLSLYLEKMIHPHKKGLFRTFYTPGESFFAFQEKMKKSHPLILSDNKIESGFLPLVDAREDTLFGAYLLVT